MSETVVSVKITHEYLMHKSKSDLADEYLRLCDTNAGLREGYNRFLEVCAERDRLRVDNKKMRSAMLDIVMLSGGAGGDDPKGMQSRNFFKAQIIAQNIIEGLAPNE